MQTRHSFILALLTGFGLLSSTHAGVINVERATVSRAPSKCPGNNHLAKNPSCCVWYDVLDDIQENLFDGGECGEEAHESIRLAFHDAVGYSLSSKWANFGRNSAGGADGSIMKFDDIELAYSGNAGLDEIVESQKYFANTHKVSYGDIIQFTSSVALSNCPGSPRVQFLAGRGNATVPAPESTLPSPWDSVPKILMRMADAGFTPDEVVALMASHSLGGQDNVDKKKAGWTFDTTPNKLDSQFFLETLLKGTDKGRQVTGSSPSPGLEHQFRLQSDYALARSPITSCTWQSFVGNPALMSKEFGKAMEKLALVGQTAASLTDCSEVIPTPEVFTDAPMYPAGKSRRDVEVSCAWRAFPTLDTSVEDKSNETTAKSSWDSDRT
ncbi:Mn peroxidase MNP6 [Exidia glandulosa HHB12029]|uniref:Peroxidase n=1 Tax=Exidia glandulosa HHB12029 TaxID=1314781 RepID=A0A165QAE6_EXIGL|nr:Mn peroxidase MNP6 [Exidia glandulosa HHB12029]